MADSREDVNEKLDGLLLAFFEKLETLQCLKQELATDMKNGFLLMSKARYSMGNKSVTSLQYGDKMTATVRVHADESCSKRCTEKKEGKRRLFKEFSEDEFTGEELESKTETLSSDLNSKVETLLRKRSGLRDKTETIENVVDSKIAEEKNAREKGSRSDPLKWFGVLVPTSLRQCQKEFKSSCQLLCDIAELEHELNEIIVDFKKLKEQKNKMKS